MIVTAVIIIVFGLALIFFGIVQSRRRIDNDGSFITAEGEITGFKKRLSICTIHHIPIFAHEYSPIIRYTTAEGEGIESCCLPYSLKISKTYKEYKHLLDTHTPIEIKYSPVSPQLHYYNSRKGFFIREAVYKFAVGALVISLGAFMIWLDIGV